jgi:hypothetical protein
MYIGHAIEHFAKGEAPGGRNPYGELLVIAAAAIGQSLEMGASMRLLLRAL